MDRREALQAAGARGDVLEELLVYGLPLLTPEKAASLFPLQLPDDPQLETWRLYAAEAARSGSANALYMVFPQMRYPVRKGISETEGYRAASRRGVWPEDDSEATGVFLNKPQDVHLTIEDTLAGKIPIIVAGDRSDFQTLVRAFSARNEPVDVPASMGACLVRGLNNWDRVRLYRRRWEEKHPGSDWEEEFKTNLVPQRDLYQDRFIILSNGPYSGVPAKEAGFPDEEEWRRLSVSIRREHEATHFFTLRTAGTMRINLVDELLCDYVGLVRTFGRYPEDLALRFFGLESFPAYRQGARLQNYRGNPPISDDAFRVTKLLAFDAVRNLARMDLACPDDLRAGEGLARLVVTLMTLSLEELAFADLRESVLALALEPTGVRLRVEVPADTDGIDQATEAWAGFAGRLELPGKVVKDMNVVLDELLSNKMKYGWNDGGRHSVVVELVARAGGVELTLWDDGKEFDSIGHIDPDTSQPLDMRQIGGLGILLVKNLTDEQRYKRVEGKNRIWIRKRVS